MEQHHRLPHCFLFVFCFFIIIRLLYLIPTTTLSILVWLSICGCVGPIVPWRHGTALNPEATERERAKVTYLVGQFLLPSTLSLSLSLSLSDVFLYLLFCYRVDHRLFSIPVGLSRSTTNAHDVDFSRPQNCRISQSLSTACVCFVCDGFGWIHFNLFPDDPSSSSFFHLLSRVPFHFG